MHCPIKSSFIFSNDVAYIAIGCARLFFETGQQAAGMNPNPYTGARTKRQTRYLRRNLKRFIGKALNLKNRIAENLELFHDIMQPRKSTALEGVTIAQILVEAVNLMAEKIYTKKINTNNSFFPQVSLLLTTWLGWLNTGILLLWQICHC